MDEDSEGSKLRAFDALFKGGTVGYDCNSSIS